MRSSFVVVLLAISFLGIGCKSTRRKSRKQDHPPLPVIMNEDPADPAENSTMRPKRRRYRSVFGDSDRAPRERRMNPPGKVFTTRWIPPKVPNPDTMGIRVKDLTPAKDPELRDGMNVGKLNLKQCTKGDCVNMGKFKVRN
ncbi:hypothetical protein KKF84_04675 [Myxococcota bacterium]|nr:hypothetical protein [Myxococcota bacterium]MBU1534591.1 hypothetical protein [Myxococcota bacterium]